MSAAVIVDDDQRLGADPALGHVLRITAVVDALAPGRLATLERALASG